MYIKKLLIILPFLMGCSFIEGITPLMKAAKSGSIELVKKHTSKDSINKTSRFGWTALMFASAEGHEDVVKFLLKKGANPNIVSESIPATFETTADTPPTTALAEAISNSHLSVAKILIEHGAIIDNDAIALAGGYGDIALMKLIIQKGADIDATSNSSFYPSALITAIKKGKHEMVRFLIKNHANPSKIHHIRHNSLREAVVQNDVEMTKYMLEHKVDPNVKLGSTVVLDDAVFKYVEKENYHKKYEIIKLLLAYGADKFAKPYNGNETIIDSIKQKYKREKEKNTTDEETLEILKILEHN